MSGNSFVLIIVIFPSGCHPVIPLLLSTHHFPLLSSRCSYLFVTLSSRHPSRAIWTRRLGCLGRMCSLPPLLTYLMYSICNPPSLKPFALFPHDTLHQQPWRAALVAAVGTLMVSGLLPPRGTHNPSLLCPGLCEGLHPASLLFRRCGFLCIFLSEYQFKLLFFSFSFRFDLCGHPFLLIRPRRPPRNSLDWMSLECFS